MSYFLEQVTLDTISSMKESLFKSSGYQISIKDEIEYFNERSPSGWLVAKGPKGEVVGFIRDFPQGNWTQVELYVSSQLKDRRSVGKNLVQKFIEVNQFSPGLRVRFDLQASDEDLNRVIQDLGLSEKRERFLYFEVDPFDDDNVTPDIECPEEEDIFQVVEVLSHLHSVTEEDVRTWTDRKELRSLSHNGRTVATAHVTIGTNKAEIVRIATHPSYLRQGFGKILILQIMSELKGLGIEKLCLKVDEKKKPAVALYKKIGFKENMQLTEVWHSKWIKN